jgi:hypothetical protein
MGLRDDKYELEGVVELDDAFFKTHTDEEKDEILKKSTRKSRTNDSTCNG